MTDPALVGNGVVTGSNPQLAKAAVIAACFFKSSVPPTFDSPVPTNEAVQESGDATQILGA